MNGILPAGSDDKRVTLLNTEPFLRESTATIWSFILLMNDDNFSDDDDNDDDHYHVDDDEVGGDDENESFDGEDGTSNGVTGWFGRFNFFLGPPRTLALFRALRYLYVACLHGKRRYTLLLHHICI